MKNKIRSYLIQNCWGEQNAQPGSQISRALEVTSFDVIHLVIKDKRFNFLDNGKVYYRRHEDLSKVF